MIERKFFRTCQECNNVQADIEPNDALKKNEQRWNNWLEKLCRKCKSPALDYGSNMPVDAMGRPRELTEAEEKEEGWLE